MDKTAKSEGTMLNLQNKRTLPRQVLKWMQGLDLSYSVKDYRKDLSNGFLVGQIVSRYEPGKIPMHAFQNSHNLARKDNNWNLLHVFFQKYELRKVTIDASEYDKIKSGNDSKSQQLYQFICRLYSVCTKRNIPENTPAVDLPPTQSKNPNLTASYLLKEDGLQKLDKSQLSIPHEQSIDEKNLQDRVPTRKIAPNMDLPGQVDVKGIGMKQQINRKMTSKKKSWEAKSESFYQQTNPYGEKYVFDYLNQIVENCLPAQSQQESNGLRQVFLKSKFKPTETFIQNLPLDRTFTVLFFNEVKSAINDILPTMLKDINEIWRFFIYFIKMLCSFPQSSDEFSNLIDLLKKYAVGAHSNENKRLSKVFMQSLIDSLIQQVKNASSWFKKERLMDLVYDFSGREIQDKKAVLLRLKESLGSNNVLYVGWLAVLILEQKEGNGNQKLVSDFIYYAHQSLQSPNYLLKTSALKILSILSINGWVDLLDDFFSLQSNRRRMASSKQPQQIYLIASIYFCMLKTSIESNDYQNLIKGKNQANTNAIKVYNPDHEKQTQEIKGRVNNLAMVIAELYHNSSSQTVRQILAKEAISYISEANPLLMIVAHHMCSVDDFQDFFIAESIEYTLKNSRIIIEPINLNFLQENSNQMLAQMIKYHQNRSHKNVPSNAQLDISILECKQFLNFCLDHLNIKKLNIELWEGIGQTVAKPFTESLVDKELRESVWITLKKIYHLIFNYDMKMVNLNIWVSQALVKVVQQDGQQLVKNINQFFEEEYIKSRNQIICEAVEQMNGSLEGMGASPLINLKVHD